MKTGRMIAALLLAATMIAGTSQTAFSQKKTCSDKGGNQCQNLDLTKDQQKKMDEMRTVMMKERLQFQNQVAEKKAHLKTLSMADEPNMTEINKTIDEMYALKAEFAKKKAAHQQDVRNLLTPEQRLKFDMKHANKGMGMRGPGHGQGNCCPGHGQGMGCQGQGHGQGMGCQGQGQGMGCNHKDGAGQGCGQKAGTGQGCGQKAGSGQGCGQKAGSGQGCGQKAATGNCGHGKQDGTGQGCQKKTTDDDKK